MLHPRLHMVVHHYALNVVAAIHTAQWVEKGDLNINTGVFYSWHDKVAGMKIRFTIKLHRKQLPVGCFF